MPNSIVLANNSCSLVDPQAFADCFSEEFSKNFACAVNHTVLPANDDASLITDACSGNSSCTLLTSINADLYSMRALLLHQNKSAAEPDGIPGIFYKELAHVLALPISIVFQQSLLQGKIPDMWRLAKVVPLFKGKGQKSCVSSYRPISLTDVACKLLERLVADQIKTFWTVNNFICKEQHGFLQRRSTVTNLVTSDSIIADCLNDHVPVDVILLDFARAFDKVRHDILISKLKRLGISAKPLEWITDFLSNRTQSVAYDGALSIPAHVTSGVVQGSVLGPLLFVGFINDLPKQASHCDIQLFADDSKAIGAAANSHEQDLIQCDLDSIEHWSRVNCLPLSIDKCACLHYGLHNKRRSYTIGGGAIKDVEQCVDLGVTRTPDFRYKAHIDAICLRAARLSGMANKLFSAKSSQFLMKLFITYIRPAVEYASVVWQPRETGAVMQLERVQRCFTRRLFGHQAPSYEERLSLLGVPSLETRRHVTDLIFLFKAIRNLMDMDANLCGIQLLSSNSRGNGINLCVRGASANYIAKSLCYRAAKLWNDLPADLKTAKSLPVFKSKLQTHMSIN